MGAQRPPLDERLETTSDDSRVGVTTNDDGKYIRTAVVLSHEENFASIDILDREGRLVCRLNISQYDDSFNVDVIPVTQRNVLRAMAMTKGTRVMNKRAPVGSLVSIMGVVAPSKEVKA